MIMSLIFDYKRGRWIKISNHSNKKSYQTESLKTKNNPIRWKSCLHQSRMKQVTILLKALGLLFIAEYSAAELPNPKGIDIHVKTSHHDYIHYYKMMKHLFLNFTIATVLMCMRRCAILGHSYRTCWRKCGPQPVEPEGRYTNLTSPLIWNQKFSLKPGAIWIIYTF